MLTYSLTCAFSVTILWSVVQSVHSQTNQTKTKFIDINSNLRLAYGSMLNMSCITSADCILKHSLCNPMTGRCECDHKSIQNNYRCQVMYCTSTEDCLSYFDNSICLFGQCKCRYGLDSNGKCVKMRAEAIKQLPDWAVTLIAFGALFSGLFGGRSEIFSQLVSHVVAVMVLLPQLLTKRAPAQNPNQGQSPLPSNPLPPLITVPPKLPELLPMLPIVPKCPTQLATVDTDSPDDKSANSTNQTEIDANTLACSETVESK